MSSSQEVFSIATGKILAKSDNFIPRPVMLLRITILSLLSCLSTLSLNADNVYKATHAYTMTGKLGTDNRYGDIDHGHFEAGNTLTLVGGGWVERRTLTAKGVAIFDLHADNLGGKLKAAKGKKITLSFYLEKVEGEPRPLRVEYIGTTNDLSSERSLTAQFQRQPIHQANRVLDKNSNPGAKVINASALIGRDFTNRYLVIRFEQEGMRRELHSKDGTTYTPDLYVFNKDPGSVRITITDEVDHSAVASDYSEDGYYAPIQDMPKDPIQDMPKDPITDMPADPIQDMSPNPIQDMPDDLTSDMPKNLINDGPVRDGDSIN